MNEFTLRTIVSDNSRVFGFHDDKRRFWWEYYNTRTMTCSILFRNEMSCYE